MTPSLSFAVIAGPTQNRHIQDSSMVFVGWLKAGFFMILNDFDTFQTFRFYFFWSEQHTTWVTKLKNGGG